MIEADDEADGLDGLAMLYDNFKHVTSLCLFTLAGGVAMADKVEGRWAALLVVALVMVGVAAAISLAATSQVVDARLANRTHVPHLRFSRGAPGILLSIAIGILLYIFARSLKL